MSSTAYRAIRSAIIYLIFGFIWIFFSDQFVHTFSDFHQITYFQTVKGFVFVFGSAGIIYYLIFKEIKRLEKLNAALVNQGEEIERISQKYQQTNVLLNATIEKHEQTLDDLLKSKLMYQTYINNSNEGIYRFGMKTPLDVEKPMDEQVERIYNDSRMEEVNPVFLSMYDSKSETDVLGKSLLELHVDGKRDDNSIVMKQFVESGYNMTNFETIEIDRSGNKKVFSNNTIGIIQNGYLNSIWGTQNDITKSKEAEFELIEAKLKAEESDQLKSAFLANMSHEIRTPLNGILGFAELLDDDDLTKKDRRKFIKIINNNSNQLLQIISDILDISKIETKQLLINSSPFSLNELMDEISLYLKNCVKKLDKKIEILTIKELPQDEDWVVSDRIRVNQVITNLANNAVKFTTEGVVTIGYEIIKRKLRFFVRDSGKGIPTEKQIDVFDRFSQVDPTSIRKYGGAGLGLPISKGIVELLKGKIGFSSEMNKGSEFYFHIPLKRP